MKFLLEVNTSSLGQSHVKNSAHRSREAHTLSLLWNSIFVILQVYKLCTLNKSELRIIVAAVEIK